LPDRPSRYDGFGRGIAVGGCSSVTTTLLAFAGLASTMQFAPESVKLQFDNLSGTAFCAGCRVIHRSQTEKPRDPSFIHTKIRRFEEPQVTA
jgi:hypothetical protein